MTGPVSPVRSDSDYFGPVKLVRSVRCVYEDTRTGPIPRSNNRTEQAELYADTFNLLGSDL
jgi:hypothetical protein